MSAQKTTSKKTAAKKPATKKAATKKTAAKKPAKPKSGKIGDKKVFRTMEEALTYFNLGKFISMYDTIHSYGITDTKERVWLPIVPGVDVDDPIHKFIFINEENLILEQGEQPQKQYPDMETAHVITRTKCKGGYEFEYIGKYKQVLFNKKHGFTVHVRIPCKSMQEPENVLLWDYAFVLSAEDAWKKFDELYKRMQDELKKGHP